MKFIADSMLGRLAGWLRLLGYDTEYHPRIDDSLLLRIAREDNRTLLTRDTRLIKVRGLKNYLLLQENDPFQQLRTVITTFNLIPDHTAGEITVSRAFSRCSVCNSVLDVIPRERAKARVPEYVYQSADRFKYCKRCDKFYWRGTHQENMRKKLLEIL